MCRREGWRLWPALALALWACDAKTTPQGDSQSHWLQACRSSAECGDALCLCGVCSRACSAPSECGGADGAQCVDLAALGAECAAPGQRRICLPSCDAERSCDAHGAALSCVAGACVEVLEASRAGAGGAANGSAGSGGAGRSGDPGNAGRSATGASAGSGSAGQAGDGAADGGTNDGSSGDLEALCSPFVTEATAAPATVRFVNGTSANLFLGPEVMNCTDNFMFTLETGDGTAVQPRLGYCGLTCEQVQTGQCGSCPPACPATPVILLEPGGVFEIPWPGSVFKAEMMPVDCFDTTCLPARACSVEHTPPETMTFQAIARSGAACGPAACELCTPDASGSCTLLQGQTVTGTARSASASWTRGQALVELTF